jgi:hypothetical protein
VIRDTHVIEASQNAGAAATSVNLVMGRFYQGVFTFAMTVPHEVDPPFSVLLSGGGTQMVPVSSVPEPEAAGLWALGMLLVLSTRWQRQGGGGRARCQARC